MSIPAKDRQILTDIHFIRDKVVGTVIILREPGDNEVCETTPREILLATEFQRLEAWKEPHSDTFDQFLKQLV